MSLALEKIFGDVLRSCRKEKNMSQERLAMESNLQRTFISRLERGLTQPTLISLFELAKALEVEPVEIIAKVQSAWKR